MKEFLKYKHIKRRLKTLKHKGIKPSNKEVNILIDYKYRYWREISND